MRAKDVGGKTERDTEPSGFDAPDTESTGDTLDRVMSP